MKMIIKTTLMMVLVVFLAGPSMADLTYAFLDGTAFDGVYPGTSTGTLTDPDTGIDFAITLHDVRGTIDLGGTLELYSNNNALDLRAYTQLNGLGVISDERIGAIQNFDNGEAAYFTFDTDVRIVSVEGFSIDAVDGDQMFFTVQDGSFSDVELFDGANSVGSYFVPSGTVIGFESSTSTLGSRISSITVTSIPEPGTMALLFIAGSMIAILRRFF